MGTPRTLLGGSTLSAALAHAAAAGPAARTLFPTQNDQIDAATLDIAATCCARGLLDDGVAPGAVVGLLTTTGPLSLIALFGIVRAGAAASILPTPVEFGANAVLVDRLERIASAAGMRHIVADDAMRPIARRLAERLPGLRVIQVRRDVPGSGCLPRVCPDDLAIVQFTSGSTQTPRGVLLRHVAVMAGLRAIVRSSEVTTSDISLQWIPLYHDMGLFALLSQILNGGEAHVFAPMTFIRRPGNFLRYLAESRATLVTGPNFGYDLLLKSVSPEEVAGLDLSCWRLAYNGSEPVSAETIAAFQRRFAPVGARPSVMYPVYGMAEATLAISFPSPGSVARIVHIDRDELGTTGRARQVAADQPGAKTLVAVGEPVTDMTVRLVDEHGRCRGEGELGEIQIRGPAVTSGYLGDSDATRAAFDNGWFRTGDLGFTLGNDLFVAGRRKEMVIVHGRNFFPEDAEAIAREVPGVYRRHCVAFAGSDGGEADGGGAGEYLGVIVETTATPADHPQLATRVRERLRVHLGVSAVRVHLVAPRWLTKTSSGKWQRLLAKRRIAAEYDRAAATTNEIEGCRQ